MERNKFPRVDDQAITSAQKLLVSGFIYLEQATEPVAIWRGMPIVACDGQAAGSVAALLLDCQSRIVTHILLGYVPPTAVYRLIPLYLIDRIIAGTVWLRVISEDIEKLPVHQPAC